MKNHQKRNAVAFFQWPMTLNQRIDLDGCAQEANAHHEKAQQAHRSGLKHAKIAGKYLRRAKQHVGHGNWKGWLNRNCPKISVRTAQAYMLVAKRWKEIEHDPDRSLRQVLKALTTRPGKPKGFDYGNFIADKIFRQMLREPWKQWTNEEREQLRTDPAAQALYQDSMNKLRKEMRRGHEGFTKEEIRQGLQQARDRYHLRLRTQQEAL